MTGKRRQASGSRVTMMPVAGDPGVLGPLEEGRLTGVLGPLEEGRLTGVLGPLEEGRLTGVPRPSTCVKPVYHSGFSSVVPGSLNSKTIIMCL